MVQVQSIGEKHAWVCTLDEDFLGWGCIKIPVKQILHLQNKYASRPVDDICPRKRPREQQFETTTKAHKVCTSF